MRVLLTGGTGFLGGRLCLALVHSGHTVRVTVRANSVTSELPPEVEIANCDIQDAPALIKACEGCDAVIHTAALVGSWLPDSSQFITVERGSVWMECSIPKKQVAIFQNLWKRGSRALIDSQQKTAFELRFILSGASGRRQAEGFWPPEAVMDMLKKVDAATLELQYKAQKAAAASA